MVSLPFLRRAARAAAAPEPLFDAAFRRRLEQMALRTRQTLAWRAVGEHRSPRRAPSREFTDFRAYTQGDDLRYLDWNTFARLGEMVTRLGQISTELTVHILIDTSASMNWGDPNKLRYAKRLAAALGYLGLWHFDRLQVAPFGARLDAAGFGPRRGRAAIAPLFSYLEGLDAAGETDFAASLAEYARRQRTPGVLLLISDLLTPEGGDPTAALRPFLERGWDVIVFHTLDAQEVEPGYSGDLRLQDVERDGGRGLRVTPNDRTLTEYRAAFDRWLGEIEQACATRHIGYLRLLTNWSFEELVLRFLVSNDVVGPRGERVTRTRAAVRQ